MQCPEGHCIIKNVLFKPTIQSYKALYKSNAEFDHCQLQIKRFHFAY